MARETTPPGRNFTGLATLWSIKPVTYPSHVLLSYESDGASQTSIDCQRGFKSKMVDPRAPARPNHEQMESPTTRN